MLRIWPPPAMSCGWMSLFTNVTCVPAVTVSSVGVMPLALMVILFGWGAGAGAGAGAGGGAGSGEGAGVGAGTVSDGDPVAPPAPPAQGETQG